MVKIGDTVHYVYDDGSPSGSHTISGELYRQYATIGVEEWPNTYRITDGSYLRDRSAFGPTVDECGDMLPGNVLVGGNVQCVSQCR